MSAAATVASMVPMLVVAAMRRAEARIHRQLVDAGALTAESAIPLSLGRPFAKARLQALVSAGAVRPAADGRHFLDANAWNTHQRNRRRRALLAVVIVLALIGIAASVIVALW